MQRIRILIYSLVISSLTIQAGHPLKTEDGFSIGKGILEIELVSEFFDHRNNYEVSLPISFGYGLWEYTDILVGFSYNKHWNESSNLAGFNDIQIEVKHMFTKDEIRVGVKPFISFPTGDETIGFGSGKVNFGLLLLLTKEWEEFHIHTQFGYSHNNNVNNENYDLWEYSIALEKLFSDRFSGLLEFGISRNCCPHSSKLPKFVSLGFAYTITDDLIVSGGVIKGFSDVDPNFGLTSGVTLSF